MTISNEKVLNKCEMGTRIHLTCTFLSFFLSHSYSLIRFIRIHKTSLRFLYILMNLHDIMHKESVCICMNECLRKFLAYTTISQCTQIQSYEWSTQTYSTMRERARSIEWVFWIRCDNAISKNHITQFRDMDTCISFFSPTFIGHS